MVTKAIIEKVINRYTARVRIPIINKARGAVSATPTNELYVASISISPNCNPDLREGDIVFVAFEDGNNGKPVIIGQLFREGPNETLSDIKSSTMEVVLSCDLPEDTTIGDISSFDLKNLYGTKGNLQGQIDIAKDKATIVERLVEDLDAGTYVTIDEDNHTIIFGKIGEDD